VPIHDQPSDGRALGVGFAIAGMLASQIGNAYAKQLTDAMATPLGAVWVRLAFAGVILLVLALGRLIGRRLHLINPGASPNPRQQPKRAWLFAIAYGAVLVTMNSMFYEAIARLPVGIVITIEFLGPLAVALLGSRRPIDFAWVALAGLGIVIFGVTPTPLTLAGVGFAVAAGTCWAGYILLGARVARHWHGTGVLTGTCVAGGIIMTPAFLLGNNAARLVSSHHLMWPVIGLGALVALSCTVLPYSLELLALRRIPTGLFGILESLAPAIGALAAWIVLSQRLYWGDWLAITCVVAASLGATITRRHQAIG